jgi:hypothetical protein
VAIIAGAIAGLASAAWADQGGTPFWTSGQYASLAAVPPSPGWSVNVTGYGYRGSVDRSARLPIGRSITYDAVERSPSLDVTPGYASETKILGGQPFLAMTWGLGGNRVQASLAAPSGGTVSREDGIWGGTDLYPFASLGWARGSDNWMLYATGDVPVGAYQASRLANVGIGHAAFDAGGGYTYYDTGSGIELSAVAGFTYNWANRDAGYRNGIDSHLDWAVSRFVAANWELGVAGYVYYQLTGDSGSGAVLGPFKSRVAAIGPEVAYQFKVGGQQWQANVRAYREFWAQNRYQGWAVFATLSVPLGSGGD